MAWQQTPSFDGGASATVKIARFSPQSRGSCHWMCTGRYLSCLGSTTHRPRALSAGSQTAATDKYTGRPERDPLISPFFNRSHRGPSHIAASLIVAILVVVAAAAGAAGVVVAVVVVIVVILVIYC